MSGKAPGPTESNKPKLDNRGAIIMSVALLCVTFLFLADPYGKGTWEAWTIVLIGVFGAGHYIGSLRRYRESLEKKHKKDK